MREHEREDNTTGHADAATDVTGPDETEEQPIDPSINAGRDSFGNVSDFGVQPNSTDTGEQQQ